MSGERVLVLGGGSSQLSLLERCRARGLVTVLADRDPHAPGRAMCDHYAQASTFDAAAVLEAAREHRVQAVITAGTDQPVLVATKVCEALGLPSFLDVETALAVTNKRVMKARLAALGIPTARWILAGRDVSGRDAGGRDLAELRPPYVTKPVDSQGQRGVYRIEDPETLRAVAAEVLSWSREDAFLVEEYYPSREVTVSGWVRRGELRILTVTDRVTRDFGAHIGVCLAHRYPTHLASRRAEIETLTARLVEGLGIREGPIYFQLLSGEQGVLVNEVACRLGGAYEDRFIPRVTGVDMLDLLIRASLGEDVRPQPDPAFRGDHAPLYVTVPLLFCRPGRVHAFSDLSGVRELPGVVAAEWLQKPGVTIDPLRNSTQRVAYLVVEARDRDEVNRRARAALERMHATDASGTELLIDALPENLHPLPV